MTNQVISIRLQSLDATLVDNAAIEICKIAERNGSKTSGPIPLPNKKKIFTVIRSPHVYKDSQEHFGMTTHTRMLKIIPTPQTVDSLMKLELPAGVEVKIKLGEAA